MITEYERELQKVTEKVAKESEKKRLNMNCKRMDAKNARYISNQTSLDIQKYKPCFDRRAKIRHRNRKTNFNNERYLKQHNHFVQNKEKEYQSVMPSYLTVNHRCKWT